MKFNKMILWLVWILFIFFSLFLQGDNSGIRIGERIPVLSENLGAEVPVLIRLPEGYEKGTGKYPVVFKLNGDIRNTFVFAASSLQAMAGNHTIPSCILADIALKGQNRYFQLQGRDGRFRKEPAAFARFISDELIPYIDNKYRTAPYRILYGQSNAGMFTLYMMFKYGKKLNAFIASSPMIGWHRDFFYKRAAGSAVCPGSGPRHLAIVFGDRDLPQVTESLRGFVKILGRRKDLTGEYFREKGCGHVPYTSFYKGMRSVFRGWRYMGDLKKPEEFEQLKTHYSDVTKRFGFEVVPPYYFLFKLAFNLYRDKAFDPSEQVLLHLLGVYPDRYQAQLILARIYFETKRRDKALDQLNAILNMRPGYGPAEALMKRLRSVEGDE